MIQKILTGLLLVCFMPSIFAEDRALLVGIDEYWYTSPLKGSKQDVRDMRKFITKVWGYKPHQIRILTDNQATQKAILSTFDNWLIKGTKPKDRVLFYFSGHGYYVWDNNGDESDGYDETLCPVDTKISGRTMIRDDEIATRLKKLQGRKVTMIIDACHSGTVTRSLANRQSDPTIKVPIFGYPKNFTRSFKAEGFISSQKDIVAYSAVAPNQVALVDTEQPYRGVFTSRFIRGIQNKHADNNKDGQVTHAELLEYLRHESQAYCDRKPRQCTTKRLTPQLEAKAEMLAADVRTSKIPHKNNTIAQVHSVLHHDNQADLQIKILPRRKLVIGQSMKIQIHSQHKGYFFLFDINSIGDLTRIFPNQYSTQEGKDGYIKALQIVTIPDKNYGFEFIADKPLGKGLLVALLVEDKLSGIQDLLPTVFEQIKARDAQEVLQKLRQQLNQTLPERKGTAVINRPIHWSIAIIQYAIIKSQERGLRGGLESPYIIFAKN